MELTTLTSSSSDKKINLKKSTNPPVISNSNKNFMITSRSPSPSTDANNILNNPKPNQVGVFMRKNVLINSDKRKDVSSVILYGIPIVSLYIENQERLCLAQISNTLLKQFSYNEIHNRRVALGITCVQCTPVQLEILRRAGAMPVSSRRCGMITRREAERLCKSFLGDNSPPRLPDDFSFAAYHECAWGCRGNFLPSRYNSSRAKCIKCAYCGLFFSPNKFIFHSHRLSPNDKYVQPDAANFNSWRRHLKLSGSPPEDIAHAWEDVKAMFNGGTRKRLMSSPPIRSPETPRTNCKVESPTSPISAPPPTKRSKENSSNSQSTSTPHFQHSTRPIHHHHHANNSIMTSGANSNSNNNTNSNSNNHIPPSVNSVPLRTQELPFTSLSRSFMIDYMWHHQQTHTTSMNASTNANKMNHFQFPPYSALNWIKQQPNSFLFKPNSSSTTIAPPPLPPLTASSSTSILSNDEKPPAFNHFHSAAFKPVINAMRLNDDSSNINNGNNISSLVTSLNIRNQSPSSSTSSNYNHTTASSTNQSDDEQLASCMGDGSGKKFMNRKRMLKSDKNESDFFNNNGSQDHENEKKIYDNGDINTRSQTISDDDDVDDDDENEMVDIETTEDDIQILNLQPYRSSNYGTEDEEEEIEVTDGKLENNNNLTSTYEDQYGLGVGVRVKSPIKFLKEIVNRSEREIEENYLAKRHTSSNNSTTLNLKKEPSRHDSPPSSSLNYVHKIHAATTSKSTPSTTDGSLTTPTPTKLWSVARLSLECNNNNNNNNINTTNNSFDERNSFYQHLSQIQHKNFHHIDTSASNASSI